LVEDIDRRYIKEAGKSRLEMVPRQSTVPVAAAKVWNYQRVNPTSREAPTYIFRIVASNGVTAEMLQTHNVALDGELFDITVRDAPTGGAVLWELRGVANGTRTSA
jgi:hypothetical protein